MQEFNEGDLVEAVKGEESHRGRVNRRRSGELLLNLGLAGSFYRDYLAEHGYTLRVIEKAAPRPWLDAKISETWHLEPFGCNYNVVGGSEKNWFTRANVYGRVENVELADTEITSAVMLEPVPVTAGKVLDAVRNVLTLPTDGRRPNGEFVITASDIEAISATFGVSE